MFAMWPLHYRVPIVNEIRARRRIRASSFSYDRILLADTKIFYSSARWFDDKEFERTTRLKSIELKEANQAVKNLGYIVFTFRRLGVTFTSQHFGVGFNLQLRSSTSSRWPCSWLVQSIQIFVVCGLEIVWLDFRDAPSHLIISLNKF